jgi:hypothetical protein
MRQTQERVYISDARGVRQRRRTRHLLRVALRAGGQQRCEGGEERWRVAKEVRAQVARQQPRQAAQRVQRQRRVGREARQQLGQQRVLVHHQQRQRGAERERLGRKGREVRRRVQLAPARQPLLEEGLACAARQARRRRRRRGRGSGRGVAVSTRVTVRLAPQGCSWALLLACARAPSDGAALSGPSRRWMSTSTAARRAAKLRKRKVLGARRGRGAASPPP